MIYTRSVFGVLQQESPPRSARCSQRKLVLLISMPRAPRPDRGWPHSEGESLQSESKKRPFKVSLERPVEPQLPLKLLPEVLPIVAKRPLLEWFLCATGPASAQRKPLVNLNVPDP
jgi:hypothetical protein